MMVEQQIFEIVLDGGPCAGKSTALSVITQKLEDKGFKVYISKEQATYHMEQGFPLKESIDMAFRPNNPDTTNLRRDESFLIGEYNNEREELLLQAKLSGHSRVVIIYDRAIPGILGFLLPLPNGMEMYRDILRENGLNPGTAMAPYNAVIHMTTAAKGAEEFYTLKNNATRDESPEVARLIDDNIIKAWAGIEKLIIIGNETSFEDKINNAVKAIFSVLGVPAPYETERQFLVSNCDELFRETNIALNQIQIEQTYLNSNGADERRVRRRMMDTWPIYYYAQKRPVAHGQRIQTEKVISAESYRTYLQHDRDHALETIFKTRTCFVYENQYFELDEFLQRLRGLILLELEVASMDQEIFLPPFIKIEREVTGDSDFSNSNLARDEALAV